MKYRSQEWFYGREELGFQHRAALRTMGVDADRYKDRPIIGVVNSWSELVNCNINLRDAAAAVKRGIFSAGALPLEFPTISLGEEFMRPTGMLYRNRMAMDVAAGQTILLQSRASDSVGSFTSTDRRK